MAESTLTEDKGGWKTYSGLEYLNPVRADEAKPKKPKPKKKPKEKAVRYACGLSVFGIRRLIADVERSFRGRPEYPFSDELRKEMQVAVIDCRTQADVEAVMRDKARASATKKQRMGKGG